MTPTPALSPIYVTRPYLPPLSEFQPYLDAIWSSHRLTNYGPFHAELETALAEYLAVPYVSLTANGTTALIVALQALRLSGEVITTPFTFAATTNALYWNNLKPVFVDIDPVSFNLDPAKITAAITPDTSAIFPVHVYGRPCNTDAIAEIASTHNLKVLYDAAHTFGAKHKGKSLASFGDLAVLSFHATKIFNTVEGGAVISHTPEMKKRVDRLRNFGFMDETTEAIVEPGLNAKMDEFRAAMGLCQFKHVESLLGVRKYQFGRYWCAFQAACKQILPPAACTASNCAYFPILLRDKQARDYVFDKLREAGIFSRKYFWPLVSELPAYKRLESAKWENLMVAHGVAERVLCLPIYYALSDGEQDRVIERVKAVVSWG